MIDEAVTEIAHPVKPDLLIASRDIHPVPFGNSVATDTSADVLLKNVPAEDAIFGCYFHVDAARTFVVVKQRSNKPINLAELYVRSRNAVGYGDGLQTKEAWIPGGNRRGPNR